MQELIDKLKDQHGLSTEQSHGILATITNFIKEKFPMVAGAIDNIFPNAAQGATTTTATTPQSGTDTDVAQATAGSAPGNDGSLLDKISDFIPGAAGEKIEEFAKDKLGGMFGGEKK